MSVDYKSVIKNDDGGESNFEVLTTKQVHEMMKDEIEKVKTIINLPNVTIRLLLSKHKWDVDVFLERFYDDEIMEYDQVLTLKSILPQTMTSNTLKILKTCEICLENYSETKIIEFQCGHRFCNDCWQSFLTHSIEGVMFQSISCPGHSCNFLIDDELVMSYIGDNKVISYRYEQMITYNFVKFNRLLKWCPGLDCSNAIKVQLVKDSVVKCTCLHQFCFACSGDVHTLISCEMLSNYNSLCDRNLNTSEWLTKYAKSCPLCNIIIEKNGGCDFMSCSSCGHRFCWFCLNPIARYKDNNHPDCRVPDEVRFECLRMHALYDCYDKRKSMEDSIKKDIQIYKNKIQHQKFNPIDDWYKVEFAQDAIEVLLDCRYTLKDSFIFQFLMTDNSRGTHTELFKMHQTSLQNATERLSKVLETEINCAKYCEAEKILISRFKLCKVIMRSVKEFVQEGLEKDWWKSKEMSKFFN